LTLRVPSSILVGVRWQRLIPIVVAGLAACGTEQPTLSETEHAIIGVSFSPTSYAFGNVQVATSSPQAWITISPTGLQESFVQINSITGCTGFTINSPGPGYVSRTCAVWDNSCGPYICEPLALPQACLEWYPDETYTFGVTFSPSNPQAYSCGITVNTSINTRTFNVSGTGTAPPIDIDVTPPNIGFGDVRRNTTSSAAPVYVRNAGGQAIAVSGITVPAGFAITGGPTSAFTLGVGTTNTYSVTCTPTATGPLTGQLRVSSNDPATPTSIVNLSCNGIDSALAIDPSPLTVTTRVGEPVERTITLRNDGAASMTLEAASLTGAGIVPVSMPGGGVVIPAGQSTSATIRFDATEAGEATGTLAITYDGGQSRSSSITAKAQPTSMSLVPDGTYDFGPICIGQSKAQDVTITSNAEGAFRVDTVSTPAGPFTLTAPPLPATIQGSGANNLTLALAAAPTEEGTVTSSIDIATDIPNSAPRTLSISVTGLPEGVTATPPELDLGQSKVNSTTIGQSVEVSNCSLDAVTLSNARIEGENADDFAIVAEPSLMLAANGKARWLVVAQPHAVGTKTALFSVDHPGGTTSVMLVANGVGDGEIDDEAGVRPSYYACSTGSASGAWPIALVLVPLLRRRRR
jgi:hypothetical protein